MKIEEMLQHAKEARELSYSPYSKYAVGAVIVTKDDKYFYGANIENAAYPSGICAERCALFHTYMHGYKKEEIVALCLVADSELFPYPCGACRQVIDELMPKDAKIIVGNLENKYMETSIRELLPYSFNSANLEK